MFTRVALLAAAGLAAGVALSPAPAEAYWHRGGGRVGVVVGFGPPAFYYPRPYWYAPPVYYAPPPVVVAPPPYYVAPGYVTPGYVPPPAPVVPGAAYGGSKR